VCLLSASPARQGAAGQLIADTARGCRSWENGVKPIGEPVPYPLFNRYFRI
jgi:hypothetical protein